MKELKDESEIILSLINHLLAVNIVSHQTTRPVVLLVAQPVTSDCMVNVAVRQKMAHGSQRLGDDSNYV